jgi:hypothetical protein
MSFSGWGSMAVRFGVLGFKLWGRHVGPLQGPHVLLALLQHHDQGYALGHVLGSFRGSVWGYALVLLRVFGVPRFGGVVMVVSVHEGFSWVCLLQSWVKHLFHVLVTLVSS